MMLDPTSYIEEKQDWSLKELYNEKAKLEKYIKDYNDGSLPTEDYSIYPLPDTVASVYEDYLIELNILIEKKEVNNKTENKYLELTDIADIKQFLKDNDYLEMYSIESIFKWNENAEIELEKDGIEIRIIMNSVKEFNIDYYSNDNLIDNISIEYNSEKNIFEILLEYDFMDIEVEKVTLKTLDIINTKYQYVSVKYKEDSDKTFYYISNIEDLKIGDYVYVPVRDTHCIGIVDNIEYFSYKEVPFPVKRTKKIIRKSSAEEFESFNRTTEKDKTKFDNYYTYPDNFEFEDRDEIYDRAKSLNILYTQKVEWEGTKQNDDGTYSMPFPKYNDEIMNWIKKFYDLKLRDYNCLENYEDYKDKKPDELTFEETLSYLTYLIRGERFCDGLIAEKLEDGTIETLCKNILSTYIEFKDITEQDIENLKEDEIMCFTLAEWGAMGEPCGIEIIAKKENKLLFFRANYNTSFEGSISIEKFYPIFPTLKTLNCGIFGVVTGVQENFLHIDTGLGNHLFVNKLISEKIENELIDKSPDERYGLWFRKALDILEYDWEENKIKTKFNEIIIGYYGAAFFGGGTYEKLSKKENEEFKIEYIHSAVPNYIPNGEKYIKLHEKINFTDEMGANFIDNDTPNLISKNITCDNRIIELIKYVSKLNLKKMSKTEYNDDNILDGLCWDFYIQLDNEKYEISGYENMPKQLEKIIDVLEKLAETTCKGSIKDMTYVKKNNCECCGYKTIIKKGAYEVCPVCYWEDDPIQSDNPDFAGGANRPSLNVARLNFIKYGACEKRWRNKARKPHENEKK